MQTFCQLTIYLAVLLTHLFMFWKTSGNRLKHRQHIRTRALVVHLRWHRPLNKKWQTQLRQQTIRIYVVHRINKPSHPPLAKLSHRIRSTPMALFLIFVPLFPTIATTLDMGFPAVDSAPGVLVPLVTRKQAADKMSHSETYPCYLVYLNDNFFNSTRAVVR